MQVQATSAILQALHKQRIPMYTLALGMALKIILNYSLVQYPAVNIHGAPYASLLCYMVSLAPNLWYVAKYSGMRLKLDELIWRPALATVAMALPVVAALALLGPRLSRSWLWMLLTMLAAGVAYLAAAWRVRAITREDLPGFIRRRMKHRA